MPIIRITGFAVTETLQKNDVRLAIQKAFRMRFGFSQLDTTDITFLDDSTKSPWPGTHVVGEIVSRVFWNMSEDERDAICHQVAFLMEMYGGHTFNEVYTSGHQSMCGGFRSIMVPGHHNPRNLLHEGPFEVHLTARAGFDHVRTVRGIDIQGQVVLVGYDPAYPGTAKQDVGNLQFWAGDQPFYWSYSKLIRLVDAKTSRVLWQNKAD